ncbi:MAG: LysR family transcriptional regulator [Oscillospiraceae bacterium]|nr:LysR family transcriptional regulator [Oscillospiraceae bacterium]
MNFSSMDYFVIVAKERSFTKAAQRLNITQQSLSAHIASIERELNAQLLIRHVPLELTYAGERFLEYALEFQQKHGDMIREFGDISGNQKGVLKIGIAMTRGRTIMPTIIKGFRKLYPNIAIKLFEGSNDLLKQRLTDGEIDLAIANFPQTLSGAELCDFFREEVKLFVSDQLLDKVYGEQKEAVIKRIESGDLLPLSNCPFLMNSQRDIAGRIGRELLDESGVEPEICVEALNVETLLELCYNGEGACFSPGNLTEATLSEQQLKSLKVFRFGEKAQYMIRIGYLKQSYNWSIISDFIKYARTSMEQEH